MNIPKQVKTKNVAAIVLVAILLTTIGCYFTFAQYPIKTFTISPGIQPGAPTYTVWREGDNYFAKDAYGEIKYSGSNASQVIQNCIGNNTWIRIMQNSIQPIWITNTIIIPDNTVYLTFEGHDTVESSAPPRITGGLKLADGANCDMFRVGNRCHQLQWVDLGMSGNKVGQTSNSSNGIHFVGDGCSDCRIERCLIINFTQDCIRIAKILAASYIVRNYLEDSYGCAIYAAGLINSIISGNFLWSCKYGICIQATTYPSQDNTIIENKISHQRSGSAGAGILIINSTGNDIIGNWIDDSYYGIYLNTVYRGVIADNDIRAISTHGIFLRLCGYLIVSHNLIVGASYAAHNTYAGLYVGDLGYGTNYCLFDGNLISSTDFTNRAAYGIWERTGSDYNMYTNNYCTGAAYKNIEIAGTHSRIADSFNGTVWISSYP